MNKDEKVIVSFFFAILGLIAIYADLQNEASTIKKLIKTIQS